MLTGEKLSDIEEFHPDRMTSRILGMGDMLSIIEKAEEAFDEEEALKLEKKLKKQEFDLDDYLTQLRQVICENWSYNMLNDSKGKEKHKTS